MDLPPEDLVGCRISISGKGPGLVLGPFKKGAFLGMGASKHSVAFDDAHMEKLKLRRHGNGGG